MTAWTPWETCDRCGERLQGYCPSGICADCVTQLIDFIPKVVQFEGELAIEQTIGEPLDAEDTDNGP